MVVMNLSMDFTLDFWVVLGEFEIVVMGVLYSLYSIGTALV